MIWGRGADEHAGMCGITEFTVFTNLNNASISTMLKLAATFLIKSAKCVIELAT
jgi:hypothetical protein